LSLRSLSFERLEIARSDLLQQFLQGTTVLQTTAHLGHQLLGNVKRKTAPFYATVQNVTGMLLAGLTSLTVLAHTRAAPKIEGTESGGGEIGRSVLKPP
jgi:hypothetical protein